MRQKCKICNHNCLNGDLCWKHKEKKSLPKIGINRKNSPKEEKNDQLVGEITQMNQFFLDIWNKRKPHTCESCGTFLGYEPKTYMFDHCLEKNIEKYKFLALKEENIMYLCLPCHDSKTRGFLTIVMTEKRKFLINKYNL